VNANAKPDKAEKAIVSPLHLAAEKGEPEIVRLLIAHGAKVNKGRSSGKESSYLQAHHINLESDTSNI